MFLSLPRAQRRNIHLSLSHRSRIKSSLFSFTFSYASGPFRSALAFAWTRSPRRFCHPDSLPLHYLISFPFSLDDPFNLAASILGTICMRNTPKKVLAWLAMCTVRRVMIRTKNQIPLALDCCLCLRPLQYTVPMTRPH